MTIERLIDRLTVLCQVEVLLSDIDQLEREHGQRPELEDARARAQAVRLNMLRPLGSTRETMH